MKITHVIRNFEIGGLEVIVKRIADLQVARGNHVRVICIEKECTATIDLTASRFKDIRINKQNKYIAIVKDFFEILFNRPEIIHTHNFLSNTYGAIVGCLLRVPICLTLHSGEHLTDKEFQKKHIQLPYHYTCVSEQIRDVLLSNQ